MIGTMGEEMDPELGCDMSPNYDSIKMNYQSANPSQVPPQYKPLTILEKRFLLAVERGDLPAVRRALQETPREELNINCCDPIGRSGLLMAIDNENREDNGSVDKSDRDVSFFLSFSETPQRRPDSERRTQRFND